MYDLFGYMESAEEINLLAENLKKEGDFDSILKLAEENGLDQELAQAFIEGELPFLADEMSAAIGKLDVEAKELKPKEIMEDWLQYVKMQCFVDKEMAVAVRKDEKSFDGCVSELLKWSYKNMYDVPEGITKAAGMRGNVKLGIPGMGTAKKIIREYYLGRQQA